MADDRKPLTSAAPSGDVAAFLEKLARTPVVRSDAGPGRLIFALDATMSRQPTWDTACQVQAEMFDAAASAGGLSVQLVSFRGTGEFDARPWTASAAALAKAMSGYDCRGGLTQIRKVLRHAYDEARAKPVQALVYVGDAMEENVDRLCEMAGRLALAGTPIFAFQEGRDARTEAAFREIARLTKGAYCRFDANAAATLRDLLKAVAVYAAGGRKALTALANRSGGAALLLTRQMGGAV